jgi:hypothetical protein
MVALTQSARLDGRVHGVVVQASNDSACDGLGSR